MKLRVHPLGKQLPAAEVLAKAEDGLPWVAQVGDEKSVTEQSGPLV